MNNLIYKYASLDLYTLANLVNESIYFSCVENFDDPTGAAFTIFTGENAIDGDAHSSENTKQLFDFMREKFPEDDNYEQFNKTCILLEKALRDHIGIFCCSKPKVCQKCHCPKLNPIMLSHYSDKHRGIVIEYEYNDSKILHEVSLTNQYKHYPYDEILQNFKIEHGTININNEIIKPLLFKFYDWKYQDEFRIFNEPNKSILCTKLRLKVTRIFFLLQSRRISHKYS